jgi:hypothetical protein
MNASQGLRLRFGRSGVSVGSGSSVLSLGLVAVGYGGRLRPLGAVSPRHRGNRVWYPRGVVDEWYVNGPLGLEQGFTVPRRLAGGGGPLRLSLAAGGGLRAALSDTGGVAFKRGGGAATLRYRGLLASDARNARLPAWWSVRAGSVEIWVDDRGARYPVLIDPFVQQGPKLVGSGAVGSANEGWSVALSADGDTALIGGPSNDNGAGAAWVFTRSGSTWSQQGSKLVGTGASGHANQGWSVALSGDGNTAVIGGPFDNNDTGAAWVFVRSGSTWSQQGSKLVGTGAVFAGPAPAVEQGRSVALSADGNTALIGGPFDNGDTGAVWVFTRSGSTWSQQGSKLVGTGAIGPAVQGQSVALSGDGITALIGGPGDNGSAGAAWVFTFSGSTWSQQGSKLVGTGAIGTAV